ncbi:MAG: regulatory protein RecX [Tenacibaculum sp.]|nr:regulatory protein RecX [Tenacibaculum sp.]
MQKKSFTSIEEIKRKLESYCVYQDRCHKEVEKKLLEYDLIPEVKEEVLLHLMEHNFLNEERFSKSFARGKFRIKKWGKQRITRELKFRDISNYNIKTALKEIDDNDYLSTLYELANKKNQSISEKDIFKRKKKLINFLQYRGYETDLICKIVNEITENN